MAEIRDVKHIHLGKRLAIGSDDAVGAITLMLDDAGDLTDQFEEAAVAIVKWPDGKFSDVDLSKFDWAHPPGSH